VTRVVGVCRSCLQRPAWVGRVCRVCLADLETAAAERRRLVIEASTERVGERAYLIRQPIGIELARMVEMVDADGLATEGSGKRG